MWVSPRGPLCPRSLPGTLQRPLSERHPSPLPLPQALTLALWFPPGGWKLWSLWGECTRDCGGGLQTRTRTCLPAPGIEGGGCEGVLEEGRLCNRKACGRECADGRAGWAGGGAGRGWNPSQAGLGAGRTRSGWGPVGRRPRGGRALGQGQAGAAPGSGAGPGGWSLAKGGPRSGAAGPRGVARSRVRWDWMEPSSHLWIGNFGMQAQGWLWGLPPSPDRGSPGQSRLPQPDPASRMYFSNKAL